jgi:predicted nucleotidyltransferase
MFCQVGSFSPVLLLYNFHIMDKQIIQDYIRPLLSNDTRILLAYLFGSQASGKTGPISDVDLGILFSEDIDIQQVSSEMALIVAKVLPGKSVDIVSLNNSPVELAYAVIAQGVCIYRVNEAERVEFEAQVLGKYGDYLPVLRAMRRDILVGEKHGQRVQRYREAFRRTERTLSQIRASQK